MSNIKHCGFCSLLSGLMRRAKCMGSRSGSTTSYYREIGDQDTLKIDGSQASEDSVEIHDDSEAARECDDSLGASTSGLLAGPPRGQPEPDQVSDQWVSPSELLDALPELEALRSREGDRNRPTGRFHSTHKRRRRRLPSRSLIYDEALLDDLLIGQVQCVLEQSSSWDFNAFTLDNVAGGRGLLVLSVHLFQLYGLIGHFHLDPVKVWKLFTLFEVNYHSTNPYHNSIHAADVTQAMHCFLQQDKILKHMQPIDVMAGLLAAIAHDLDHPGVNQPFLVATSNHLVALYQNKSVLENHHWRSAISCLIESNLMDDMPQYQQQLQDKIRSLILATDITRQQDYLGQFKAYLDSNSLDLSRAEHRHLVLQIALKCADISNPCRLWEISRTWSVQVCEEFFRQGDVERRLNLPLSPLCDRNTTSVPSIQTGFFKYVVTPLITEWHRFLQSDLSEHMLKNLVTNHKRWEAFAKENRDVNTTPEAAVEAEDEPDPANLSGSLELLLPRRSSLNPSRPPSFREQLRRFSAPLNVFQDGRPRNRERTLQEVEGGNGTEDSERADERTSGEELLPEPTIASITTPMQAQRIMHVFSVDRNWKLVRQPTFPPLEVMSRAHSLIPRAYSLIPRASSHDDCVYPRSVKSESVLRMENSQDEQCRPDGKFDYGNRLRENLTAIPLDLGRRRKSMPARSEPLPASRERRLREVLPCLIARTLTPRPGARLAARRGSAPAPSTDERPALVHSSTSSSGRVPRACQLAATPPRHALPRRSSLPVEVMTGISSC